MSLNLNTLRHGPMKLNNNMECEEMKCKNDWFKLEVGICMKKIINDAFILLLIAQPEACQEEDILNSWCEIFSVLMTVLVRMQVFQ